MPTICLSIGTASGSCFTWRVAKRFLEVGLLEECFDGPRKGFAFPLPEPNFLPVGQKDVRDAELPGVAFACSAASPGLIENRFASITAMERP